MSTVTIAKAFPPGDFIKEELEARGWTQQTLAEIMGRQTSVVSAVVNGKRGISLDIANELSAAFGTSADYWVNLEKLYQQFLRNRADDSVAKRARIFELAPVKDMIKRNWIKPSNNWAVIEAEVKHFLGINSIYDTPKEIAHAAKKSSSYDFATPAQRAWLIRARKMARGIQVAKFSDGSLADTIANLRALLENPEDVRQVPKVFADGGIRFLVLENIAHAKMDGACFWLDKHSPVIALGMRYDRLDNFWYVTAHETGHVKNGDGLNSEFVWDANLVGDEAVPFSEKSEIEKKADLFAQEMLIDQATLDNWIARVSPLYSKAKIMGFARLNRVHPAIVLGQLQHRGEVQWSHSREMLVKVRDLAISTTLTDGFGQTLSADV